MKNETLLKFIPILLGILIIFGGAFLRVNEALLTDVWYDEAFTGVTIRQSWSDVLNMLSIDRNHPPLFYGLVKIVTAITGSSDPFHIRLVSLFFGIATVPLGYLLIQQLSLAKEDKKWLGIATMCVLSFSPFFVSYSTEARSYAFLLFLMLVAIICFIKASKNSFKFSKALVVWGVMLLMIMLTHFLSILILSGFFVAFVLLRMEENTTLYNSGLMKRIGVFTFLGWLIVTWAWTTANMGKLIKGLNLGWIPKTDLSVIPKTVTNFLFGVDSRQPSFPSANTFSFSLFMGNIGFVILIASVIAFVIVLQNSIKNKETLRDVIILTSLGIVPLAVDLLASSFELHIYVDRYVIGYGTMLIIWLLYVWWRIANKEILWIICGYLALLCFVDRAPYLTKYSEIVALIPSDSSVTIGHPLDYLVFKYYLPETKLKLLKMSSGEPFYNWQYTPESIQVAQNNVMPGSLIIVHKLTNRTIPSTWQQKFETSEFRVYEYK
jgi:uncharacterized membrane protein